MATACTLPTTTAWFGTAIAGGRPRHPRSWRSAWRRPNAPTFTYEGSTRTSPGNYAILYCRTCGFAPPANHGGAVTRAPQLTGEQPRTGSRGQNFPPSDITGGSTLSPTSVERVLGVDPHLMGCPP